MGSRCRKFRIRRSAVRVLAEASLSHHPARRAYRHVQVRRRHNPPGQLIDPYTDGGALPRWWGLTRGTSWLEWSRISTFAAALDRPTRRVSPGQFPTPRRGRLSAFAAVRQSRGYGVDRAADKKAQHGGIAGKRTMPFLPKGVTERVANQFSLLAFSLSACWNQAE